MGEKNIWDGEMGRVWVQLLGGQGACIRVILVLHECIWNAPVPFDDPGSLGSPPCQVVMGIEVLYRPSNIRNTESNKIGKDNAKY